MKWKDVTSGQDAPNMRISPTKRPYTEKDKLRCELKRLIIERKALEEHLAATLEERAAARAARIMLLEIDHDELSKKFLDIDLEMTLKN